MSLIYAFSLIFGSADQQAVVVDRVAAIIENTVVTQRELEDKAKPNMAALVDVSSPTEREKKRQEILHAALTDMISDKLIETELAKVRDKLGVTDAQVDKAFEETAKSNHMDKEQLQQVLYNQGQTVAEFKQTLRKQIERSQYMQFRMQGKTGFTEKDLIQRCNELRGSSSGDVVVRASHILLKVAPDASAVEVAAALSRANDAYAELKKGANFADLATRVSDDKGSKGGDIGYFHRGEMVPQFDAVAFTEKVGEISKPVRTQFGFHVIRVDDKKAAEAKGCDDEGVKAQVSNELYNRELERQLRLWVDELRKKAYVDVKI